MRDYHASPGKQSPTRPELAHVRQQGYAVAQEELEEGLSAVAAPIMNYEGHVIAAISVSGPSFRLTEERLSWRKA